MEKKHPGLQSSYTVADQQRMTRARNYFAWQARLVLPELGRRVLEVGSGIGNFTGMLLDRDIVVATDIDQDCTGLLRQRFPDRENLQVFTCAPGSPEFQALARFQLDCCVCLNVLEHIEDDQDALRSMASVLTTGGAIVLIVPAFPALYGPIDRNLHHFRRYSRDGVAALASKSGLRIRKLHYVNLIGFFGWLMNARVLRKDAQSEAQIEVFDRLVVPVMSRIEGAACPPFGQSLFAVLEPICP